MRRFKVETADLRLRRRLAFARWSGRETAPMVEVGSSRFSIEVTDLYKQRLGDGERGVEVVFYGEKTVSRVLERLAETKPQTPCFEGVCGKKEAPRSG